MTRTSRPSTPKTSAPGRRSIIGPLAQIATFDENKSSEFNPMAQKLLDLIRAQARPERPTYHRAKGRLQEPRPEDRPRVLRLRPRHERPDGGPGHRIGLQRDPEEDHGVIHLLLRDGESKRIHFQFDRQSLTAWATDGPVVVFEKAPLSSVEAQLEAVHPQAIARSGVAAALSIKPDHRPRPSRHAGGPGSGGEGGRRAWCGPLPMDAPSGGGRARRGRRDPVRAGSPRPPPLRGRGDPLTGRMPTRQHPSTNPLTGRMSTNRGSSSEPVSSRHPSPWHVPVSGRSDGS